MPPVFTDQRSTLEKRSAMSAGGLRIQLKFFVFLKLFLNVPYQALFQKKKNNKNDRSPFSLKRCNGPVLPYLSDA